MKHNEFMKHKKILDNNYSKNRPVVSIVMPTYCRMAEGFLSRCIESVLNQTYRNFEYIIIDDGSIDGSKELITKYALNDNRIVYVRYDENCGLPAVRTNEGILLARGEYIAFIFDDNIWEHDFLEVLLKEMVENPADVQYSITEMKTSEEDSFKLGDWPLDNEILFHLNTIPNGSVLCKREFFSKYGLYDPHICIRRLCDWDLWFRSKILGATFNFVNKVLSTELGPTSPVSLGLSVKMDYKLTYAYMTDESRILERTKKLLPKQILDYNVFEISNTLPYIKNYSEYMNMVKTIYEPFFDSHKHYSYDFSFNNTLFNNNNKPSSISPFDNELGLNRKLRILIVSNVYNDCVDKYKKSLQHKYKNSIVITCGEWQLSAYSHKEIDVLILVDCTALFIYDYILEYKKANILIIYLISYGVQDNAIYKNVLDYNKLDCVQKVFKMDLYFPKKGVIWQDINYSGIKKLMDISDIIVDLSYSKSLPILPDNKVIKAPNDRFIDNMISLCKIIKNINYKSCYIFLNSGMVSGSEVYGIELGSLLHSIGLDVQICIPKNSVYGEEENYGNLNKIVTDKGMKDILKAPYNEMNFINEEDKNGYIENLEDWIKNQNVGLIIGSSFIKDIVKASEKLNIHTIFSLFQPTGYNFEELKDLKVVASGIVSDSFWAANLYNNALDVNVIKIPTLIKEDNFKQYKDKKGKVINIAVGGTLQPRKRQYEAIIACHKLIKDGYKVKVNIYGYKLQILSHYAEKIENYIIENNLTSYIQLYGMCEMQEIINNNDIILSTSEDESIPQTLLIGIAGGLVPVSCPCGGIPEVIKDKQTGYLTTGFDIDSIYFSLKDALNNRDKWPQISNNAQTLLKNEYSFSKVREEFLDFIIKKTSYERRNIGHLNQNNYDTQFPEEKAILDNCYYGFDVDNICFVQQKQKIRKYGVTCHSNKVSEIGIIFASEISNLNGEVKINLYSNGRKIRESKKALRDIKYNTWEYFGFMPIYNCCGTIFTIELIYNEYYHGFGIFEDRRNRKFLYKVFNKIGLPLRGMNTLYVHFKE